MLISEFARATGLSADTIRFYVRRGLIDPQAGTKGGRNPYQLFTPEHVRTAQLIRIGQALGLSLKEIGALLADVRDGRMDRDRSLAIMLDQRDRLRRKASEIGRMAGYLDAKITWVEAGSTGEQPQFADFVPMRDESVAVAPCHGTAD
ncbi:MerR family transcriptional regulator [Methylobacterium nonmethylotrophicum]|uniref:MerR family transcriptional regulator n=1 Tax=Methylobacterium nonmethylotrophicum TaxID=1141884 RepID=A0A4Z0NRW4_9HYPH|nr:MerR family transcriptional regulator [Methylobacterium nonmethylotrophicum]TGD98684.1 MerR family transcriptional regulator [Methylobacterium nonmethylotrophicum]